MSDGISETVNTLVVENPLHVVHMYEISVDQSQQGESLGEMSDVREADGSLQSGTDFPLALLQTVNDISSSEENAQLIVLSECPGGEGQDELVEGITAAILSGGHGFVMNDSAPGCTDEALASLCVERLTRTTEETSDVPEGHETQVLASFEMMPSFETPAGLTCPPDTVLASALSSKPISSTLPIVSKHVQPSPKSPVLTVERLDADEAEGDDGQSDKGDVEQQHCQLEEHW